MIAVLYVDLHVCHSGGSEEQGFAGIFAFDRSLVKVELT